MALRRFTRLLAFLQRLDEARIPYSMRRSRDDGIMVVAFAPGQYWEIDFLEDGGMDIERFHSNGHIDGESVLEELFERWCSEDGPQAGIKEGHGAVARK